MGGHSTKENVGKNNITFTLIDGEAKGTQCHGELGKITVTHQSLTKCPKRTMTETRPIGKDGAKLEFRVILSGKRESGKVGFRLFNYSIIRSFDHSIIRLFDCSLSIPPWVTGEVEGVRILLVA